MRDGTNNSTNLYVYFLNPKYHYTKDFSIDGNVEDGLYDYIEHMVPNKKNNMLYTIHFWITMKVSILLTNRCLLNKEVKSNQVSNFKVFKLFISLF